MLQRLSALSAETLAKMSPEMREFMEQPAMTYDPRNAELLPGAPAWYVIEVWPGAERKVGDELVARRFGIYVPQSIETVVRRGRKFDQMQLLFPGYIFAFVWDVLQHRARIERIPGVSRVILDVNGVPLPLSDVQVGYITMVENGQRLPTAKPRKKGRQLTRSGGIRC